MVRLLSNQRTRFVNAAIVGAFLATVGPAGGGASHDASADERGASDDRAGTRVLPGITGPHLKATLGVARSGRVARIAVAEGLYVHQGDVLVELASGAQRAQLAIAAARAESNLDVELARTRMQHAARGLKRMLDLNDGDYATPKELHDAELRASVLRFEFEIESFRHAQAVLEYKRQQRLLDQLSIRAPFDGYVTEVMKHVGETVGDREGVLTLMQLDPLEVVVDSPLDIARWVRVDDTATVVPLNDRSDRRVGRVVFVSRVVEPASQTARVKLHVTNEDAGWMAGIRVEVDFGETPARRAAGGAATRLSSEKAAWVSSPAAPPSHNP